MPARFQRHDPVHRRKSPKQPINNNPWPAERARLASGQGIHRSVLLKRPFSQPRGQPSPDDQEENLPDNVCPAVFITMAVAQYFVGNHLVRPRPRIEMMLSFKNRDKQYLD